MSPVPAIRKARALYRNFITREYPKHESSETSVLCNRISLISNSRQNNKIPFCPDPSRANINADLDSPYMHLAPNAKFDRTKAPQYGHSRNSQNRSKREHSDDISAAKSGLHTYSNSRSSSDYYFEKRSAKLAQDKYFIEKRPTPANIIGTSGHFSQHNKGQGDLGFGDYSRQIARSKQYNGAQRERRGYRTKKENSSRPRQITSAQEGI